MIENLKITDSNTLGMNYKIAKELAKTRLSPITFAANHVLTDPNNPLTLNGATALIVEDENSQLHMFYVDPSGVPYSHDVVTDKADALMKLSENVVLYALDGSGIVVDAEGNKYRALNNRPL